jgi:NagD protein
VDILERVRMANLEAVAYTNGTFHAPAHYYEQLAAIGLPFAPGHILTPASVAAHHFGALDLKKILLIAAEGVRVPVEAAGIKTCAPGDPLSGVEAVLVGWQPDFSRKELDAACAAIWAGADFFATSLAPYFASANGRMIGISGAISAMVTSVTGKQPTLLGKPGPIGLKMAAAVLKAPVASLVVVGDDPKLELLMARRAKAHAIGVTTGESDHAAFMAQPVHQRAHEIYASLPEAMESHLFPAAAKFGAKRAV